MKKDEKVELKKDAKKDALKPRYAQIVVDIPAQEVNRAFQYLVPDTLRGKIEIGSAVIVPFHHTRRVGYVVGFSSEPQVPKISSLAGMVDENPFFDEEMVSLCSWIGSYYFSTTGESLRLAFPPGRGRRLYQEIALVGRDDSGAEGQEGQRTKDEGRSQLSDGAKVLLKRLDEAGGNLPLKELLKSWGKRIFFLLKELEAKSFIEKRYRLSLPQVNALEEKYAKLNRSPEEILKTVPFLTIRAPKQEKILQILLENSPMPVSELLASSGAASSSLNSLAKKGLVSIFFKSAYRKPDFFYPEPPSVISSLTTEQSDSVQGIREALKREEFSSFLLQGVTGSGKTEVYLRAIDYVLKLKKSAIVLVPEIALTPQTVHRFQERFGQIFPEEGQPPGKIAVLHSGLSLGERYDQWRGIKEGRYKVVVGARSALFAPVKNLGLIIVDEEHEATYKQERNPRYHARDVALKRGAMNKAVVILGSATPSLESKSKAELGEFQTLRLTKRIGGRELPRVELVDMREENRQGNRAIFSLKLQQAMKEVLGSQEKTILFLNRRGFSSFILCRSCGFVPRCKRCAISLTYHYDKMILSCHHCDYVSPVPEVCPRCQSHQIGYYGVGTQRVENELKALFPETSVIRMDADTTTRRGAHREKLLEFQSKKSGILLGTQMIAKGLDFPEVTLVGVVNADTALNLPDFRAAERTFQLLMQVSGRAGRGTLPGRVIIQTYLPESYAIKAVLEGDYDSFYNQEIRFRQELNYPPFCRLINILVTGKNEDGVAKFAAIVSEELTKLLPEEVSLLGPAPAPLAKIRYRYRWHLLLKVTDPDDDFLRECLKKMIEKRPKGINLSVDVDPTSLL